MLLVSPGNLNLRMGAIEHFDAGIMDASHILWWVEYETAHFLTILVLVDSAEDRSFCTWLPLDARVW